MRSSTTLAHAPPHAPAASGCAEKFRRRKNSKSQITLPATGSTQLGEHFIQLRRSPTSPGTGYRFYSTRGALHSAVFEFSDDESYWVLTRTSRRSFWDQSQELRWPEVMAAWRILFG
ncbi:unnamed protein product [Prunus armeniaca]